MIGRTRFDSVQMSLMSSYNFGNGEKVGAESLHFGAPGT